MKDENNMHVEFIDKSIDNLVLSSTKLMSPNDISFVCNMEPKQLTSKFSLNAEQEAEPQSRL
jgi:hypothetical protein